MVSRLTFPLLPQYLPAPLETNSNSFLKHFSENHQLSTSRRALRLMMPVPRQQWVTEVWDSWPAML